MGDNIAGSFSPASMRAGSGGLGTVFDIQADKSFTLRADHPTAAVHTLLFDQRVPAQPLAAFLLRDYGIVDVAAPGPTADTLVELFRHEYGLTDDAEFLTVYDPDMDWNSELQNAEPGGGFQQLLLEPESDGLN